MVGLLLSEWMGKMNTILCCMQYDPHWFFATSAKTLNPLLRSSSTMPSFACSSKFSNACWQRDHRHGVENCSGNKYCTWTTREPVSWQANDAHLPFSDLLTLRMLSISGHDNGEKNLLSKNGRSRSGPRQFHDLAPDMRSMLVNQRLGRIPEQQFRDDEKSHVFFTIKRLLENVASVAIGSELNNTPSGGEDGQFE